MVAEVIALPAGAPRRRRALRATTPANAALTGRYAVFLEHLIGVGRVATVAKIGLPLERYPGWYEYRCVRDFCLAGKEALVMAVAGAGGLTLDGWKGDPVTF